LPLSPPEPYFDSCANSRCQAITSITVRQARHLSLLHLQSSLRKILYLFPSCQATVIPTFNVPDAVGDQRTRLTAIIHSERDDSQMDKNRLNPLQADATVYQKARATTGPPRETIFLSFMSGLKSCTPAGLNTSGCRPSGCVS
jgi:hypothetical protein